MGAVKNLLVNMIYRLSDESGYDFEFLMHRWLDASDAGMCYADFYDKTLEEGWE